MKKILPISIILIIIIILIVTSFSGCSNVSQLNKLQAPWNNYEQFTYELSKTEGETSTVIGTMVMTFERILNENTVINGDNYNINGSLCTMELDIAQGDSAGDSITSIVAFKTDFTPIASYKISDINGIENTSYIKYNTSKNKGTLIYNGIETEFKQSASYYDNEMLYSLVRASDLNSKDYTMSFASTDNIDGGSRSISVAKSSTELTINVNGHGDVPCTAFSLTASAEYGNGTTLALAIAKSPLTIGEGENATDIVKAIVKITEGVYNYTLTNVSLTEE